MLRPKHVGHQILCTHCLVSHYNRSAKCASIQQPENQLLKKNCHHQYTLYIIQGDQGLEIKHQVEFHAITNTNKIFQKLHMTKQYVIRQCSVIFLLQIPLLTPLFKRWRAGCVAEISEHKLGTMQGVHLTSPLVSSNVHNTISHSAQFHNTISHTEHATLYTAHYMAHWMLHPCH